MVPEGLNQPRSSRHEYDTRVTLRPGAFRFEIILSRSRRQDESFHPKQCEGRWYKISNARLKRDLGVELAYPTYREGLEQLWNAGEGRPV